MGINRLLGTLSFPTTIYSRRRADDSRARTNQKWSSVSQSLLYHQRRYSPIKEPNTFLSLERVPTHTGHSPFHSSTHLAPVPALVPDLDRSQTPQRPLTEMRSIRNSCESCNHILATSLLSPLSLQLHFRCIFHFSLVKSSAEIAN